MSKIYRMQRDLRYGMRPKLGSQDGLHKTIYSSMFQIVNCSSKHDDDLYGGVFNLEFSPDSSILAAACERKTFILWDPITLKEIKVVENAHTDCVNCIKFLDRNTFATCSDDTTIALWDVRNLNNKMRSLSGHSNWVKSVEYDPREKMLISSGFDGSIYSWSLNSCTENSHIYKRIFHTSGLMRCRLSPDSTKLVMCTTGGYLIVIHDLNLEKLAQDLDGFKPNIFRLMQMGRQHIPVAAYYKSLFYKSRTRNRVELISDFPEGNDAEVISSLQIHPHGWCSLSRNISYDESSEWTCVHDIQEIDRKEDRTKSVRDAENVDTPTTSGQVSTFNRLHNRTNSPDTWPPNHNEVSDLWEAVLTIRDQQTRRINSANRNTNPQHQFMHYIARISSGLVPDANRNREAVLHDGSFPSTSHSNARNNAHNNSPRCRTLPVDDPSNIENDSQFYDNTPRLVRFIEEANIGKGFIKESCFSSDGRIVCSPYGYGLRLLGFSEHCSELSTADNNLQEPVKLTQICQLFNHKNVVVSTRFSPRHFLLVSGCLNGQIISHNPVL